MSRVHLVSVEDSGLKRNTACACLCTSCSIYVEIAIRSAGTDCIRQGGQLVDKVASSVAQNRH